uniref:Ovule protein n=1 Tax=Ascaris lumbricoides TaxID=6252 RepID=A0A0M3HFK9_ASCLU
MTSGDGYSLRNENKEVGGWASSLHGVWMYFGILIDKLPMNLKPTVESSEVYISFYCFCSRPRLPRYQNTQVSFLCENISQIVEYFGRIALEQMQCLIYSNCSALLSLWMRTHSRADERTNEFIDMD